MKLIRCTPWWTFHSSERFEYISGGIRLTDKDEDVCLIYADGLCSAFDLIKIAYKNKYQLLDRVCKNHYTHNCNYIIGSSIDIDRYKILRDEYRNSRKIW